MKLKQKHTAKNTASRCRRQWSLLTFGLTLAPRAPRALRSFGSLIGLASAVGSRPHGDLDDLELDATDDTSEILWHLLPPLLPGVVCPWGEDGGGVEPSSCPSFMPFRVGVVRPFSRAIFTDFGAFFERGFWAWCCTGFEREVLSLLKLLFSLSFCSFCFCKRSCFRLK